MLRGEHQKVWGNSGRSARLGHGLHGQLRLPKLSQELGDPTAPHFLMLSTNVTN